MESWQLANSEQEITCPALRGLEYVASKPLPTWRQRGCREPKLRRILSAGAAAPTALLPSARSVTA
jgi:hypothetical protein